MSTLPEKGFPRIKGPLLHALLKHPSMPDTPALSDPCPTLFSSQYFFVYLFITVPPSPRAGPGLLVHGSQAWHSTCHITGDGKLLVQEIILTLSSKSPSSRRSEIDLTPVFPSLRLAVLYLPALARFWSVPPQWGTANPVCEPQASGGAAGKRKWPGDFEDLTGSGNLGFFLIPRNLSVS